MSRVGLIVLSGVVLALAAGCGGGGSPPSMQDSAGSAQPGAFSRPPGLAAPGVQARFRAAAPVRKALAATDDPFGGGDPVAMVDRLFTELGEASFQVFFSPAPQPSQDAGVWRYRYYPGTDTYIGVPVRLAHNEEDGLFRDGIYLMGGTARRADGKRVSAFDEQPLYIGQRVRDFVPPTAADPILCPGNQWRVNGACAPMVADFALDFSPEQVAAAGGIHENVRFVTGRGQAPAAAFPARHFNFLVYLQIPHRPGLQFDNEATIDFWVKMDSALLEPWWNDASQPAYCSELVAKTDNETGLRIDACPNPDRSAPAQQRVQYFGLFSVPNLGTAIHNGGPYGAFDTWTRLTVTQSNIDGYRFYMNGTLVASNPSHRADFFEINRSDLFVGGGSPANSFGRAAWIQSLRIYKRAMTANEVARLN